MDVIITDSPIALGSMYTDEKPYQDTVLYTAHKYKRTLNIFVKRKKAYNPNGRNQTEAEAIEIDNRIIKMLDNEKFIYVTCDGSQTDYDKIVELIKMDV